MIFGIENNLGLWALLALVPFLIIYLRSPRPVDTTIPSLMFLTKDRGVVKKVSFLRRLIQNILFYIQLFAILLLAFSVAAPFITLNYSYASDNTVIIIDSSASMQANNRFDRAIDLAKGRLSGRVTIIEAMQSPRVVEERAIPIKAQTALDQLIPKATTTNIGDALMLANDILEHRNARVIVYSDFIHSQGQDVFVAKKALESNNKEVEFVDLSEETSNVGIIDLEVGKEETRVFMKNYGDEAKDITIQVGGVESQVSIGPRSIESFIYSAPSGISSLKILPLDDFPLDNEVLVSIPLKKKVNALLITNKKQSHLEAALRASSDLELTVAAPPVVPPLDHDVVVVHEADPALILPGTFQDIRSFVDDGGALIIGAQENMPDTLDLLPARIQGMQSTPGKACVAIFDSIFPPNEFTQDPCFITLNKFYNVEVDNTTVVRLEESSSKNPIVIEKENVVFVNIIDEHADFKSLAQYPIFWNKMIEHLVQPQTLTELNHRTGDILSFKEQEITTPSTKKTTSKLFMEEQGKYTIGDKNLVANLLSDRESDVGKASLLSESIQDYDAPVEVTSADRNLEMPFIIAVLILLLIEIIYVKIRGDF